MKKIYFLWCAFILVGFWAKGQSLLGPNEHQQRINNGLHLYYAQLPNAKQYEMMLSFRFGSMAEDADNDGLGYVCHTVFLSSLQQQLKKIDQTIMVDGRFGFDVSTYRFTVKAALFEKALNAIAQHYTKTPDSTAIAAAIAQNAMLFGVAQSTLMYPAEQDLIVRQWGNRAPAFSLYGNIPVADSITIDKVNRLYAKGFCIEFALLAFNGPENFRKVWSIAQDALSWVSSCPGELFNTKLANLFPQPMLSSQIVHNVGGASSSRYQKMYQGAYVSYDPQGTIATLVLKQLLTQSKTLDLLCDSMGIDQVRIAYEPLHYASSLTWHLFPIQDSLHVAYANLDSIIDLLASGQAFSASELEAAKAALIKHHETLIKDPSKKLYLVSRYWSQNTLNWLTELPGMINKVDAKQIKKVISNYVVDQKYTSLLLLSDKDTANYDFNKYTTTYPYIDSVKFFYQKNTAKFASPADDSTLVAFVQTLQINNDLLVAINAQAYKSELLNVKDDSLAAELNQYEGFYIYPNHLLKDNKSYRLDIYRTAKLIGILLKAGVLPKQLKGTGTILPGDDHEVYKLSVSPVFNKKKL